MDEYKEEIANNIRQLAIENGYDLSENVNKIANAKHLMYGSTNWKQCPCDRSGERFCISEKCKKDIQENGICHCSLYKRKD